MDWAASHPPAPLLSPYHQFAVQPALSTEQQQKLSQQHSTPQPVMSQPMHQMHDTHTHNSSVMHSRPSQTAPKSTVQSFGGGGGSAAKPMSMPHAAAALNYAAVNTVGSMRPFVAVGRGSGGYPIVQSPTSSFGTANPIVYSAFPTPPSSTHNSAAAGGMYHRPRTPPLSQRTVVIPTATPAPVFNSHSASDMDTKTSSPDGSGGGGSGSGSHFKPSRKERDHSARQLKIAQHTAYRQQHYDITTAASTTAVDGIDRNHSLLGVQLAFCPSGGYKHVYDPDSAFFQDGNEVRLELAAKLMSESMAPAVSTRGMQLDQNGKSWYGEVEEDELPAFRCQLRGCSLWFHTVHEYDAHYQNVHRHRCRICSLVFTSSRLCDLHFAERHDPYFTVLSKKQAMFECLVDGCGMKFDDRKHRKHHLVKVHRYPNHFIFDTANKHKSLSKLNHKKSVKPNANAMAMDDAPPQPPSAKPSSRAGNANGGGRSAGMSMSDVTPTNPVDANAARKLEILNDKKAKLKQKKREKYDKRKLKQKLEAAASANAQATPTANGGGSVSMTDHKQSNSRPTNSTSSGGGVKLVFPSFTDPPPPQPVSALTSVGPATPVLSAGGGGGSGSGGSAIRLFAPRSLQLKQQRKTQPQTSQRSSSPAVQFAEPTSLVGIYHAPNDTDRKSHAQSSVDAGFEASVVSVSRKPITASTYRSQNDDEMAVGLRSTNKPAASVTDRIVPPKPAFGKSRNK